jgi:hypothetical protein
MNASDGHPASGYIRSWEEAEGFLDQFAKEKVLLSWQKLDENVTKDLSSVILRMLLCGITKGRRHVPLPPDGISLEDGTRLVGPKDLKLTERSVAIWLPYLPDWRMLRVEECMLRFLRKYGWAVENLSLSHGAKEDEIVMEWEVRV